METARRVLGGWRAAWPVPSHLSQVLLGATSLWEAGGQWEPRVCLSQLQEQGPSPGLK